MLEGNDPASISCKDKNLEVSANKPCQACAVPLKKAAMRFKPWFRAQALAQSQDLRRFTAFPANSSSDAGENHQQKKKIKRFIFYRDFLVHSRDLDSFHGPASSQGLSYNNCRAGLWGTAGMLRLSLYVGRTRAVGTCGPSVTETLPLPLHAEMSFTALEPLPARQQQPQLQAAACQL